MKITPAKRIAALEAQLRTARSIAASAIAGMASAARTFTIMRDCTWMQETPRFDGPRFLCDAEVNHFTRLCAEYTAQLKGAEPKFDHLPEHPI